MEMHYLLILDKSGSMESRTQATKNAVKQYLKEIHNVSAINNIDAYVTVMSFDAGSSSPFDYHYKTTPIRDIDYSLIESYSPNGGTQLIDAIAKGIIDLQETVNDEFGKEDIKVLCSIFSDGEENSSCLFTLKKVAAMIKHLRENKWEFTFQCAGETSSIARFANSINISEYSAYENSDEGFKKAYATLGSYISKYSTAA